jgi:hypothetical protein
VLLTARNHEHRASVELRLLVALAGIPGAAVAQVPLVFKVGASVGSAGPVEPVPAAAAEVALRTAGRGFVGVRAQWWGSDPGAEAFGAYFSSGPCRGIYAEVGIAATTSSFHGERRITRAALAAGGGFLLGMGSRTGLGIGANLVQDPRHSFVSLGGTLWLGMSKLPRHAARC